MTTDLGSASSLHSIYLRPELHFDAKLGVEADGARQHAQDFKFKENCTASSRACRKNVSFTAELMEGRYKHHTALELDGISSLDSSWHGKGILGCVAIAKDLRSESASITVLGGLLFLDFMSIHFISGHIKLLE